MKVIAVFAILALSSATNLRTKDDKTCAGQDRFDVIMCDSHMCDACILEWCTEQCQAWQLEFPGCRCSSWPESRKSFSTGAAVEEGRSIYNNMKAFIRYLISSNIGEVASIFFTAALGIPEGLAPVQLLWVNLVTDGLPATALGFNPPDLNVMSKPPRRKDDNLISGWVFFRYMVVGLYVGFATVGIFAYWYIMDEADDKHTLVTMSQLATWGKCSEWPAFTVRDFSISEITYHFAKDPCSYFNVGKVKASTLSLTVLVIIEMLNAFNALSEDGSLVQMLPWTNPYLIVACMGSVSVHFVILYTPVLAKIFAVCPLDWHDWGLVMAFSFPVIIIDEVLKCVGRQRQAKSRVSPHKTD